MGQLNLRFLPHASANFGNAKKWKAVAFRPGLSGLYSHSTILAIVENTFKGTTTCA